VVITFNLIHSIGRKDTRGVLLVSKLTAGWYEMTLKEDITRYSESISASLQEENGIYELTIIIAQRKAFLSRQKLEYKAKIRIDDYSRVLKFTELLKESGMGLSVGEASPGFGFKAEKYTVRGKMREGTIVEQSNLFGKKYEYTFDFKTVRSTIEELAVKAGYQFKYQITSIGL
jgi:hypothetical protein